LSEAAPIGIQEATNSRHHGESLLTFTPRLVCADALALQGRFFGGGAIPSEIGYLTLLTDLSLDEAKLTGEIPSELGLLTNLKVLTLMVNSLEGTIPSEMGNLAANLSKDDFFNLVFGQSPINNYCATLTFRMCSTSTTPGIFGINSNDLVGRMPLEFCSSSVRIVRDCSVECGCCACKSCHDY
jgi:hypothetical protein